MNVDYGLLLLNLINFLNDEFDTHSYPYHDQSGEREIASRKAWHGDSFWINGGTTSTHATWVESSRVIQPGNI